MKKMPFAEACIKYLKKQGIKVDRIKVVRDFVDIYSLFSRICKDHILKEDGVKYIDYDLLEAEAEKLMAKRNKTIMFHLDALRERYGTVEEKKQRAEIVATPVEMIKEATLNIQQIETNPLQQEHQQMKEKYFGLLKRVIEVEKEQGRETILSKEDLMSYIELLEEMTNSQEKNKQG